MAGSVAVLFGIVAVALGFHEGDAIASLVVAAIIFTAAARLIYENARVLMDTTPLEAQADAEAAIRALDDVELRQLRLRESGGHYFADATIGAAPDQALVASHQVADRVEAAVRQGAARRRRRRPRRAAARGPRPARPRPRDRPRRARRAGSPRHRDLPPGRALRRLHAPEARRGDAAGRRPRGGRADRGGAAARVGGRRRADAPGAAGGAARAPAGEETTRRRRGSRRWSRSAPAPPPRRLHLLATDLGLVVFVDVVASPEATLEAAHDMARRLEQEIRRNRRRARRGSSTSSSTPSPERRRRGAESLTRRRLGSFRGVLDLAATGRCGIDLLPEAAPSPSRPRSSPPTRSPSCSPSATWPTARSTSSAASTCSSSATSPGRAASWAGHTVADLDLHRRSPRSPWPSAIARSRLDRLTAIGLGLFLGGARRQRPRPACPRPGAAARGSGRLARAERPRRQHEPRRPGPERGRPGADGRGAALDAIRPETRTRGGAPSVRRPRPRSGRRLPAADECSPSGVPY